jgi:hypothetical protein
MLLSAKKIMELRARSSSTLESSIQNSIKTNMKNLRAKAISAMIKFDFYYISPKYK